jgi:hypothetical protein
MTSVKAIAVDGFGGPNLGIAYGGGHLGLDAAGPQF